jgi:hypothetical protein
MERHLHEKIVTHNHPSGNTFSYKEVLTCINLEYSEFRVITEHYSYSLKPRTGGWPPLEKMIAIFTKETVQDGDARHKCYETLAEQGNIEYQRNPLFY